MDQTRGRLGNGRLQCLAIPGAVLSLLLVLLTLVSCQPYEAPSKTGGVTLRLQWPDGSGSRLAAGMVRAGVLPDFVARVKVSLSGPGMTSISQEHAAGAQGAKLTDVPAGKDRELLVLALDAENAIRYQGKVSGILIAPDQVSDLGTVVMALLSPPTPTGLTAVGDQGLVTTKVTLTWNPVKGADSYTVHWGTSPGVTTASTAIKNVTSPFVHTGLRGSQTYYYVVTALNATGASQPSEEVTVPPVPVFDAFNTTVMDGAKWETPSLQRTVSGGVLKLDTAIQNAKAGETYSSQLNLADQASPVLAFQADIKVVSASVTSANGTAQGRTSLELAYREAGYGNTQQDFHGIRVELRKTATALTTNAYMFSCADLNCATGYGASPAITWTPSNPTGAATLGTVYTVGIRLDPATNIFTITINGISGTLDASSYPYFNPAHFAFGRLRTQIRAGNTDGDSGQMSAEYDNVKIDLGTGWVNYDDFTTGPIDNAKWSGSQTTVGIAGGALSISQSAGVQKSSENIGFKNSLPIAAISAEVKVTAFSDGGNPAVLTKARMGGVFFHEGSVGDGRGGQNGDVWAEISISSLGAVFDVVKCLDPRCNTGLSLPGASQTPLGVPLTLGQTYQLSIAWDGAVFRFRVDGNPEVVYDPVATGGVKIVNSQPSSSYLSVGTRITGTLGASDRGSISALFDNVRITNRVSMVGGITVFPLDTLSGPGLDQHRWDGCAFSNAVSTNVATPNMLQMDLGCMHMKASASYTSNLYSRNTGTAPVSAVSADVLVPSIGQAAPVGGQIQAFVGLRYQPAQFVGTDTQGYSEARIVLMDNGDGTGLRALGTLLLCTNADCSQTGYSTTTVPVSYDLPSTLKIQYNSSTAAYDFYLGQTLIGSLNPSVFGPNTGFNPAEFLSLRLASRVRNGAQDGGAGDQSVLFDNVQVDTGAGLTLHDDFTAATIDTTKWIQGDAYRAPIAGSLNFYQRQSDTVSANHVGVLGNGSEVGIWADATITQFVAAPAPDTAVPSARVLGRFYNDGSVGDGKGGVNGDIVAVVQLSDSQAKYVIARCIAANCSTAQLLSSGVMGTALVKNQRYRLGVLWTGQVFRFHLDSVVTEIDPAVLAPIVALAKGPWVGIGTRVGSSDLSPGVPITGVGEITAFFNNVTLARTR
ncbi:MAG: fibronectin type III domain-containing protein [Deltaproteobacteria bacterium]|nr:fibronectin type III domain-containing protein [Deltaproteobacteria bacterium]